MVDVTARELAHAIIRANASGEYGPLMRPETHAPEYGLTPLPEPVPLPRNAPVYPEINPGYPGPFLRDPGELDPWEERYGV